MIKLLIIALASVFQNNAPEIEAKSFEEYKNIATINTKATDIEDGELTTSIDTSPTIKQSGLHKVTHSVTDSDGATTSKTSIVLVNDGSYIVGENKIMKINNIYEYYKNVDTTEEGIKKSAKIQVYDKLTAENETLTQPIKITYGNPEYSNALGRYEITIELVNDPTVKANITAIVSNLQIGEYGEEPVIQGLTSTYILLNEKFDPMIDLKISAYDKEDGDITSKVIIKRNTVDTSKEGIYSVIFYVEDKRGNTDIFSATVQVVA
jgi:hypothetical protein